jgi:hypothetical protein
VKPFFLVFAVILLTLGAYVLSLGGESTPYLALPFFTVGGIVLVLVGVDVARNRIR